MRITDPIEKFSADEVAHAAFKCCNQLFSSYFSPRNALLKFGPATAIALP